jgi:uncharacterized protein with GYD domain
MPLYLTRFSYTPETWARLIKKPEDRRAAATQYIESVGGKLPVLLTVDDSVAALEKAQSIKYQAPGA